MKRKELLEQVIDIVCRQRQDMHGKPENSLANIAGFWSVYLDKEIKPHDVAAMMVLFKMARAKNNPANDENWMDAAGYAACGSEVAEAAKQMSDVEKRQMETAERMVKKLNEIQKVMSKDNGHESPDKCRVTAMEPYHLAFGNSTFTGSTWCGESLNDVQLVTAIKDDATCPNCLTCVEANLKPYYRVKPMPKDPAPSSKYGSIFVSPDGKSQFRYDAMNVLEAFDRWVEEDWNAVKPLRGPQDLPDNHFLYTLLNFSTNNVAMVFSLYRDWKGLPACVS